MKRIFILGAAGFVGREAVKEAVRRGLEVTALVRTAGQADELRGLGATPVIGDARQPSPWADRLAGAELVLDLLQPSLPRRLTNAALRRVAGDRIETTRALLDALAAMPPSGRPLLLSVSGMSDLLKDDRGVLSDRSARATAPRGFARIGVPVQRLVRASGLPAAFVHLGTVYGPGKGFARDFLPALARGRLPIVGAGGNRIALVHVADAGRGLAHLMSLGPDALRDRTWLLADGAGSTQREFLEHGATLTGGPPPRRLPRWLVALLAGPAVAQKMAEDDPVDASALLDTGFRFEFPSHHTGLPATLRALAARRDPAPGSRPSLQGEAS